jgi:ABC-2 type transport system ATP-binding protein
MSILVFLAGLKNVPKKLAKERALVWLQKFGLQDYANAKIEELSKGMAQKVQFIGSVLHQPRLIILDEPFSGLDPVSQDLFKTELRAMAAEGTTIILSSHQMNIMEELCDRIFLIHKGKEVFFGSLAEIKQKYGNYQVSITTADTETLPKIANLPFVHACEYLHANKAVFTLKEEVGLADFIGGIPPKLPILELNASRSSLHDIFVKIAIGAEDEK